MLLEVTFLSFLELLLNIFRKCISSSSYQVHTSVLAEQPKLSLVHYIHKYRHADDKNSV